MKEIIEVGRFKILHKCSLILQDETKTKNSVLNEVVTLLPYALQYPSIAAARIIWNDMEITSPDFVPSKYRQYAEFTTKNRFFGIVEVVYKENHLQEIEKVFLEEENDLIGVIASMICTYLNRIDDEDAFRKVETSQYATINNTNFLIWSVNREYELISFNKSFADFMQKIVGVRPRLGIRITDNVNYLQHLKKKWAPIYEKAFAGETFKFKSEINEHTYEYSLSPIVEEEAIIGITIFGEEISERVRLEREMLVVNKRLAETRLMALRAAMNPHFVFNALNSIQYYILKKDSQSAVTYLSKFSKLIRTTLDNSILNRGTLTVAIEMIQLYIELESLRFEDKFEWAIYISPEIYTDTIEVPSLLIQPYIENAIVHGLYNKKEKGLLKISFNMESSNLLLVEVEDNGIGREAAMLHKQQNLPKQRSWGVELTEERLKILNGESKSPVEIVDLEADGTPAGTLVRIRIKI